MDTKYGELWRNGIPRCTLQFTRLLDFFRMEMMEDRLEKALEIVKFDNLSRLEDEEGFYDKAGTADKFYYRGTSEHWKDELTSEQANKIVEHHGGTMQKLGYDIS